MSDNFIPDLVSVIIPTFNRKQLLIESLASVVAQTYRPIELIVIDDGSSDDSAAAAQDWFENLSKQQAHKFTFLWLQQVNSGAPRARNYGLKICTGEFIQFLDSDDILHPRKLDKQVAVLKDDCELSYVYSSHCNFESEISWTEKRHGGSVYCGEIETHLMDDALHTDVGVYRRSACRAIGPWNETFKMLQDREYSIRLILLGKRIEFLPGLYAAHRQHIGRRISKKASIFSYIQSMRGLAVLITNNGKSNYVIQNYFATTFFRLGLRALAQGETMVARRAAHLGLCQKCSKQRWLRIHGLLFLCSLPISRSLRQKLATSLLHFAENR